MPILNPLFFQSLMKEMSDDEQIQLNMQLKAIYGEEPHTFPELPKQSPESSDDSLESSNEFYKGIPKKDFELCKKQLLALLTYIEGLDPVVLELFSKYKQRVDALSIDSAKLDILVTLRATKTTLERSLPSIISGYKQVDKAKLDSLTVTFCYTGANSNIETAVGYFFDKTSLSNSMHQTKRELLRSLAADFLRINQLIDALNIGNEIHYVNSLFNSVAHDYGLQKQRDDLAPNFTQEVLDKFSQFIREQLDVAALIMMLPQFLPEVPPTNITQTHELQMLDDFFQSLGEEKPRFDQYQLLYNDEGIDDATYVRKSNWDAIYASVLAYYLEKAGYISQAQITIKDKKLLNSGEFIVDASNGTFEPLKDEDANYYLSQLLLQSPNMPPRAIWRIIQQFPTTYLLELYSSLEHMEEMAYAKVYCFYRLLESLELSVERVEYLFRKINPARFTPEIVAQQRALARYVFSRRMMCSHETLDFLVTKLSGEEQLHFLIHATINNAAIFVSCLLSHNPTFMSSEELLLTAINYNATEVITLLQQLGINLSQKIVHIPGYQGLAPAHIATHLGCIEVLNTLSVLGVSLEAVDNLGLTPACIATANSDSDLLIALHQLGVDLNKKISFFDVMAHHDLKGRAPVHIATVLGHIQILQTLKNLHVNLDAVDAAGLTSACIAVITGNLDVLEELHRLGADLSIRATKSEVISLIHAFAGCAPVHMAITLNKKDVLQKLKGLGYSLDEYNEQGDTPACLAARTNNVFMLRALYELGVDLTKPNAQGLTPGCIAAKYGNRQILNELKTLSVDLNHAGSSGATPLYTAAKYGRSDSIITLHKLRVDFNIPDDEGNTPVLIAAKKGHTKALKWLKEYGANLNSPNHQGDTPAYVAVVTGQLKAFDLLREWGADLSQIRENGEELWRIAAEKQDTKMLNMLLSINVTAPKVVSRTPSPTFFAGHIPMLRANSPVLRMTSPISRPAAPLPWSIPPMEAGIVDENEPPVDALPVRSNSGKRPAPPFLGSEITKKAKKQEPQNPEVAHGYQLR